MDDLRRFTCAVRSIHRLWSSSVSDSLLERVFLGHEEKMAYAGSDRLAEMPGHMNRGRKGGVIIIIATMSSRATTKDGVRCRVGARGG